MKLYEVYHYTYGDVCNDPYFGKIRKHNTIGIFCDTEKNIKAFVDELNSSNHSYYAKKNPKDECDEDEDYFSYFEVKPVSVNEYLSSKNTSSNNTISNEELKNILVNAGIPEEEIKELGL